MDLVSTIRKEGSRGGRADFKWSDVQGSQHRENYLGHSLMAPVGRWQKGRDLSWYAKANDSDGLSAAERAKQEREEEIKRIKKAEQDALGKALGYEIDPEGPLGSGTGANAVAVAARDGDERPATIEEGSTRVKKHRRRQEARTSIITGTDATITVVQDPEIDREVQEALTTTTTIEKVIIGVESARCLEIAMMQGTMTKIRDGFDMTKEEVGMDAFLRHVPCLVLSHIRGRRQDTGKGRGATMVILGVREVEANFEEADHLDSMICYLSESTQTVVMT